MKMEMRQRLGLLPLLVVAPVADTREGKASLAVPVVAVRHQQAPEAVGYLGREAPEVTARPAPVVEEGVPRR